MTVFKKCWAGKNLFVHTRQKVITVHTWMQTRKVPELPEVFPGMDALLTLDTVTTCKYCGIERTPELLGDYYIGGAL